MGWGRIIFKLIIVFVGTLLVYIFIQLFLCVFILVVFRLICFVFLLIFLHNFRLKEKPISLGTELAC